ncbi:transglycosylase domain-containing protein [Microbacterium deminutum]|uniref:Transglycosylase domain-containing protein n=1 Tax=Microbacterium deminutum TaxID=344164 RepID=A0ABN2RFK1_9MICO
MLGGIAGLVGLSAVAGVLIAATVTPAVALSGAAASSAITMFDQLPSVLNIDKLMLPTTLYAKNPATGKYIVMTQFYDQNRSPVQFDQIAPVMYDSILSSEDPRYYQHGGVDLIGTTRAILTNLKGGGETQGGSSISQQYVKNILVQRCEATAKTDDARYKCWTDATTAVGTEGVQRKLQEMRYAIALEQRYSKNEILLGYLNIANFGGTTYGIDAASRYYFGVAAKDLNLAQAATLAGIVQNPNTYRIDQPGGSISDSKGNTYNKAPDGSIKDVPKGQLAALDTMLAQGKIDKDQYLKAADGYSATKGRELYVLSRLLNDGKITQAQYEQAVLAPISPKITSPKTGCAAATGVEYFCQYVRYIIERDPAFGATPEARTEMLRRGGLNVYTTIDLNLQSIAQSRMNEVTPTSVPGARFGSTSVSIEASTGRVLSIAQNTKFSETVTGDDNYSAVVFAGDKKFGQSQGFNAGSTFKLFTLVDWLEKGHSLNEVLNGRNRVIRTFPDSCYNGGTYVNVDNWKPGNFGGGGGFFGTPMRFTAQSLNSGFIAMASQLDLCDIGKVASKMGVTRGDGDPIQMQGPNQVIGSDNVSPIAMAGAYGTIANNGIYCQPRAIDKVTDSDGKEITLPARTCTQVVDPKVAATAAYALKGVMASGGTGSQGNPYDGTPLIGKTGTHQALQTWLIEANTRVATANWVGNVEGSLDLFHTYANGMVLSQMRYSLAKAIQGYVDWTYPAGDFPAPDSNLIRQVLTDLPNVVGMSVTDATNTLNAAGFDVILGAPVDSSEADGIVAAQSPGAGKVAGGTPVTISPSNGQGIAIPEVSGMPIQDAISTLRGAGFGNVKPGTCKQDDSADKPVATGTSPSAGTVVNRNSGIAVDYASKVCAGGKGKGNNG